MTKRYAANAQVNKFIFLTEQEYILYFGENYEESVIQANKDSQPVVRARNGNGIISAIPTERANFLLEKYHKLLKKNPTLLAKPDALTEGNISTAQQ